MGRIFRCVLFSLAFYFLGNLRLYAQEACVSGHVVDSQGRAVEDVTVIFGRGRKGCLSTVDGAFRAVGLPEDTVSFSHFGYATAKRTVQSLQSNGQVILAPRTIEIGEVYVTARRRATRQQRVGYYDWWPLGAVGGIRGAATIAVHIPNPHEVRGVVKRVRFQTKRSRRSNMIVQIFMLGVDKRTSHSRPYPGPDTLLYPYLLPRGSIRATTTCDVHQEGVPFPRDGAFVCIRMLDPSDAQEVCPLHLLATIHDRNGLFYMQDFERWSPERLGSGREDYVLPNVSLDILYPKN